jgi:hypothetical protein
LGRTAQIYPIEQPPEKPPEFSKVAVLHSPCRTPRYRKG